MSKVDKFLYENTYAVLCFFGMLICGLIITIFYFDYNNMKDIYESDISKISYVEGTISKITNPKTNYEMYVTDCDKEFYIHKKYIEDILIEVDDYVIIHYSNNSPIRGEFYEIVNLEINGDVVYTLEEYKEENNPSLYLGLLVGSIVVEVGLLITGIILLKYYKPVSDVEKFVMANKDKYNLTYKQAEEVISQFQHPKSLELDKPKEEVYKMFENAIYNKNNRIYISGLELMDNPAYSDIFFEVLADQVSDNELKVIYEDGLLDDSQIYIIFRINNKVAVLELFTEEETDKFHISNDTLFYINPKVKRPSIKENELFINEIKKYNLYNEDIFIIE